jgi:hypothetical protein
VPCPHCDHTLTPLGCCLIMGQQIHYCVRCGTVKPCGEAHEDLVLPEVVRRCREFEQYLIGCRDRHAPDDLLVKASDLIAMWHRLGIAEAINRPEDRKL